MRRKRLAKILGFFADIAKLFAKALKLDLRLFQRVEKPWRKTFRLRSGRLQIPERFAAGGAELFKLALEFFPAVQLDSLFDRSGHGYAPAS
ncbi:hypothetical protein [Mesorhizobium sp. LSJC285A00]|uniref:hypothetical protein n=1 Tax=Mesorhizobium sp. LSJC285A00 TaxID=1287338 RepID=UPI0018DE6BF6|nr:hypothetical protein [Mesorhizobium sp. LSJC285A00]